MKGSYLDQIKSAGVRVLSGRGKKAALGGSGTRITMQNMVPDGLCPLFYHNIVPYAVTLLNGGWFGWVRKDADALKRRQATPRAFKGSRVNSFFTNEVLVQCPNSGVSVVGGIGVLSQHGRKSITLRVLRTNGECPAGHKEGMEVAIDAANIPFSLTAFNAVFPYLISAKGTDAPFVCADPEKDFSYVADKHGGEAALAAPITTEYAEICSRYSSFNVDADVLKGPCRYHTRPVKDLKAGPGGLCLDALHAIYPYGLALLYGAEFNKGNQRDSVRARCPGGRNSVAFRVERVKTVPGWLAVVRNAAAKAFEKLFFPVDLLNVRVRYVVAEIDGNCPAGLNKGDAFDFNMGDKTELCPASFHSIYPYLYLKKKGIPFDWGADSDGAGAPCPDCMGAVYRF